MEVLRIISDRAATSAIEKYGTRSEDSSDTDRLEVYYGPNIRAFLVRLNLDPSDWRKVLEYNRFGSLLDLVEGQTQLAIPSYLARN